MPLTASLNKKIVGILGGGQLARMLAMKARQMGLYTIVLSEKISDPAVRVANRWIKGNINSAKDIRKVIKLSDVITFESEFISADLLQKSLKDFPYKKVHPNIECLGRLQDRLQQVWCYDRI